MTWAGARTTWLVPVVCKMARTEADLHTFQVRAAALEVRIQVLGMPRTFIPYQALPMGYGVG